MEKLFLNHPFEATPRYPGVNNNAESNSVIQNLSPVTDSETSNTLPDSESTNTLPEDQGNSLRVEFCNIRSIGNKSNLISTYFGMQSPPDILFLTETWLKPYHNNSSFCPVGYEVLRCDRIDSRGGDARGGGVLVLYKRHLNVRQVDIKFDNTSTTRDFDILCIDVFNNSSTVRLCCVYNPPSQNSSAALHLCSVLNQILITKTPLFILGDFNFPNINWLVPCSYGNSSHDIFLDFCSSNGLVQCIDYPTHDMGNILDLIICNQSGLNTLINHFSCSPPWHTDHFLISLSLSFCFNICPSISTYPDFKSADYVSILEDLSQVQWDSVLNFSDHNNNIQPVYDKFLSILDESISKHVPIKTKKPFKSPKKPRHIRQLLKKKQTLYKECKLNPLKKSDYKAASKSYDSAVNIWMDNIESKLCDNPDAKKFYSYANRKLKTSHSVPPLLSKDGNLIFSEREKANYLNSSFQSYFTEDDNEPFVSSFNSLHMLMPHFEIFSEDIFNACAEMKNKVSRTPEGIPTFFIKKIISALVVPLCLIYNYSLQWNSIPLQWKRGYVVPIFKKGDRRDPNNFRPVSLTSSFCRLLEAIISKKILHHLLLNNLVSSSQFGFLPHRSSCGQLLSCLDKWYVSFFSNQNMSVLYTDLSKAFDTVNHRILVKILKSYGINTETVAWLENFLSNRYQQVCLGSSVSSPLQVLSGVPQGSVIGPLLFLIFINNITDSVDSLRTNVNISMFADDTKLYSTVPSDMQSAIYGMTDWVNDYRLKLANHKCFMLNISKPSVTNDSQFYIADTIVESKTFMKDLGVFISHDLKWSAHVDYIYNNASSVSYHVLKTFKSKNISTLKKVFVTYIRPKLEYNSPVWSPYLIKDITKVERVQRHFTKVAFLRCGVDFVSYDDRLRKLNIKSLQERRIYFDLVFLYKIIHGLTNLHFSDYFVFRHTYYNLRGNSQKIDTLNKFKSHQWSNTFFARVVKFWNAIPDDVAMSLSLNVFKHKVKQLDLSPLCRY